MLLAAYQKKNQAKQQSEYLHLESWLRESQLLTTVPSQRLLWMRTLPWKTTKTAPHMSTVTRRLLPL